MITDQTEPKTEEIKEIPKKNPKRVAAGKKASERREQIKNELRKHKMPVEEPETVDLPIITGGICIAVIFGIYMFKHYNTPIPPTPTTPTPKSTKEEYMYMQ